MPPRLILVRHAEALHNVAQRFHLPDPELSGLGVTQCADLQTHLRQHCPLAQSADLIVTSPMRRTLQTTQLSMGWLIDRGIPVVLRAEWQENSSKPCDTGSKISAIESEFPLFDFSSVDPLYPSKTGAYEYTQTAVLKRGQLARAYLRSRPESVILVVTHSAFLRTAVAHRRFANADYRIFSFSKQPNSLDLIEDVSTEGGGGMGRSVGGIMAIEEGDFPDADEELR